MGRHDLFRVVVAIALAAGFAGGAWHWVANGVSMPWTQTRACEYQDGTVMAAGAYNPSPVPTTYLLSTDPYCVLHPSKDDFVYLSPPIHQGITFLRGPDVGDLLVAAGAGVLAYVLLVLLVLTRRVLKA